MVKDNNTLFENLARDFSKEELQTLMENPYLIVEILDDYVAGADLENIQEEESANKDGKVIINITQF
jgi:hypothetical protein